MRRDVLAVPYLCDSANHHIPNLTIEPAFQ